MRSVRGWIVLLLLGGRSTRFDGSDGVRMIGLLIVGGEREGLVQVGWMDVRCGWGGSNDQSVSQSIIL